MTSADLDAALAAVAAGRIVVISGDRLRGGDIDLLGSATGIGRFQRRVGGGIDRMDRFTAAGNGLAADQHVACQSHDASLIKEVKPRHHTGAVVMKRAASRPRATLKAVVAPVHEEIR